MRGRPTGYIAACLTAAVSLASCGGGDDTAATAATLATTNTIVAPVDPDRCEGTPDPADYPVGEAPTAIRPCETPDETISRTIREGSGPAAEVGDGVVYHATVIRSEDGELVNSSWTDGRPRNLPSVGTGAEIAGLDENLLGVRAGQVLRLDVVADDAFGDTPPTVLGAVRAGDALTFVVEVLAIVPALDAADAPRDVPFEPSVDATEVTTEDLVVGDGEIVEEGDTVVIAMLLVRGDNGVVLVDSWHQQNPLVITLDPALLGGPETATLPGIFDGIQGARVGGRRVIVMPPSAAWGDEGRPALGLPPDTDVVVIADVLAAY